MYVCGCEKYLASLKIIFLERARNHLELSGDKLLLDLRWGGAGGRLCFSSPNQIMGPSLYRQHVGGGQSSAFGSRQT